MKKVTSAVLLFVLLCFAVPVSAKTGDTVGVALHTDIMAYINDYAIPSYAVDGQSVIVAEDLKAYGFFVVFEQETRTLQINRSPATIPEGMTVFKDGVPGSLYQDIIETDIKVYVEGVLVPSYAINGQTMIPIEALDMVGEIVWDAETRTLPLLIDTMEMRGQKQAVGEPSGNVENGFSVEPWLKTVKSTETECYPMTNIPAFGCASGLNERMIPENQEVLWYSAPFADGRIVGEYLALLHEKDYKVTHFNYDDFVNSCFILLEKGEEKIAVSVHAEGGMNTLISYTGDAMIAAVDSLPTGEPTMWWPSYSDTHIPSYFQVTYVWENECFIYENVHIYTYPYTDECISYPAFLREQGWTQKDAVSTGSGAIWYYMYSGQEVVIKYNATTNQVQIVYKPTGEVNIPIEAPGVGGLDVQA